MPRRRPIEKTTIVVDAPVKEGEGPARRYFAQEKELSGPGSETSLWTQFHKCALENKSLPALGWRPIVDGKAQAYSWMNYEQLLKRSLNIGSGLIKLGVAKGDCVGLFSANRVEWVLGERGCLSQGCLIVPLYDTLGDEAIEYVINQTEMKICFVSSAKVVQLCKGSEKTDKLKTVILMDPATDELRDLCIKANLTVVELLQLEKDGEEFPSEPNPGELEDVCTIMYTSGTTGLPKGVMLTHKNIISEMTAVDLLGATGEVVNLIKHDVHISYLPLAHVMERQFMTKILSIGGCAGFYQGDPLKLLDDLQALKPTFFPSVPRLLNRIYDKIHQQVDAVGGMKKKLFDQACAAKKAGLRNGSRTHWLWDPLVFKKLRLLLGGRVRAIVTGSAPLSPDVLDFYRYAFGCGVFESYGATETAAGSTFTTLQDTRSGHVGIPGPCCELKLVDIPEMNYTSKDQPFPRGEICIRGTNVFVGYYKDPEKTKDALDEDGWYHTGDVGLWDDKNTLKIIDRKKNIFKLAQGEYIAPEKIESIYQKSKYVAQSFVYGDSLKAFLVAVIVPDPETLLPWCQQNGVQVANLEEACQAEKVKELILKDITKVGKDLGLKSFEQVKQIYLDARMFSVENDLLSPTLKLKRPQAKAYYKTQLDEMNAIQDVIEAEKSKKENA